MKANEMHVEKNKTGKGTRQLQGSGKVRILKQVNKEGVIGTAKPEERVSQGQIWRESIPGKARAKALQQDVPVKE